MRALVVLAWFLTSPMTSAAVRSSQTASVRGSDLEARVDEYVKPYLETGNFTGAILIGRGKEVLLSKGYGMANYELDVPNAPDTVFHLASVSKPFTSAAILRLEKKGKLKVSDPLSQHLPDFPNGDRITIHHVLIHSTGIPNINTFPEYDQWSRFPQTTENLVEKFRDKPLEFEPGDRYSYSNSNYNLLAHLIEKLSGVSYGEFLREEFFEPLGMTSTGHDGDPKALIPRRASGYAPVGRAELENAPYLDWSIKTGNGSLYSTVGDLFTWHRALTEGKVLDEAEQKKNFTEHLENVGYGWFLRERFGGREIYINGRSPGFVSYLGRFVDEDLCVVVLGNIYNSVATIMGRDIAAITLGKDYEKPRFGSDRPDPELIRELAGTYQFGPEFYVPNGSVSVFEEDGHLFSSWGWLMPEGGLRFRDRGYWTRVEFQRDATGKVTAVLIDEHRGEKKPVNQ